MVFAWSLITRWFLTSCFGSVMKYYCSSLEGKNIITQYIVTTQYWSQQYNNGVKLFTLGAFIGTKKEDNSFRSNKINLFFLFMMTKYKQSKENLTKEKNYLVPIDSGEFACMHDKRYMVVEFELIPNLQNTCIHAFQQFLIRTIHSLLFENKSIDD